ncbi:MAG TPA: ABC transporter ATP-binding protein [Thermomicrobiales bacterium]|nr:ABC transporter ATP-binding protein [Thermomicrobiales bacterium]
MRLFRSLNRYWRLLARYLRPEWPRMALLAVILCAVIGVQVVTPLVAARFIDEATTGGALRGLIALALATVALALVGQGAAVAETYVAENVSWAATNALRANLLAHLLRMDAAFHTAHTPGELIERVDGDVATLARFFSRFVVYVLGNGLLVLGVLGLLFGVDWRIGLGLSIFVALALGAMLRIRAVATPAWAAERQASAEFYGFLGEYLAGLEDIRSSGAGAFVLRRCAEVMRSWLAVWRVAGMWGYVLYAVGNLFALGTVVALAISAVLFKAGALTIGVVYLVFQYTEVLRQPTEQLRTEVQDLQQADASIGRIEALLRATPRLADGPGAALPPGPLAVELDGVTFGYAADTPVLRDVSVCLAPGRVLGIVGRTGSGKTTLTRLLARFYDPAAGAVRLGGVDLRAARLAVVRARIGLVTQEVHLFNASVRDNLTLFDDGVTDERIGAVLETLGLAGWLRELPDGLDTVLGPGGLVGLSAGQAQVLACARVFLRDPDLVILDEASSRLDPATERLVHTALGRLLAGRTGVIVAHRLTTVAYADDILVLEDGRVREHGPRLALAADPASRFAGLLRVAAEEVAR